MLNRENGRRTAGSISLHYINCGREAIAAA
jgi:hypothetical protein